MSEHIAAFISAMEAAGMKPSEPIAASLGSKIIRFRCEGDSPGKRNGWAILHVDGRPAGAFGNYKLGISERWRGACVDHVSPAERRRLAGEWRAANATRDAALRDQQIATAAACRERWQRASAVDPAHPYLVRKGITGDGLRGVGRLLLVPMRSTDDAIWNLQTIDSDGIKRFAKGGRQKGLHFLIGDPGGGTIAVAEGYATAAVIRRATSMAVAVAFSAKNLVATALAMRERFPLADIVIGADDDAHLVDHPTIKRNLGLEAAHAAAQAIGGRVAVPPRNAK